jgi:malonate-semialdehyde dehydrogenase (acetylating) / methylmalonate-semialdehyde dehydrogenase
MNEADQVAVRVRELSHFIDGQRSGAGRVAARVPLANAAEVAAAKAAFPAWSETAPLKRARLMFIFKQLLDAHHDELAELITRDHSKLFSDAKGEVLRGIEIV